MDAYGAPPTGKGMRVVWVVIAGLITTALSLAGVYELQVHEDLNIMGWYGDYVIPLGAVMVGMAASSGYVLMSLCLGLKIRKGLMGTILILMLASYFAAEYVGFASRGPLYVPADNQTVQNADGSQSPAPYRRLGFWEYFHLKAVSWTWQKEPNEHEENKPLGLAGYFFVSLDIIGFSCSGLVFPLLLSTRPYCEQCERYMRTRQLNLWPASVPIKKGWRKDPDRQAEQDRNQAAAYAQAQERLNRMVAAAQNDDSAAFAAESRQNRAEIKSARKLPKRLLVNLVRCGSCSSGYLAPVWLTGQGKKLRRTKLPHVDLTPDFVIEFESMR